MSDPMALYVAYGAGNFKRGARLLREWMRTVQAGDVLESPSGTHRVVRRVSREEDGRFRSLTLAIKRCSWTKRPYTVYNFTDLRRGGWRPTGARVTLNSDMDAWMQADIELAAKVTFCRVTCCEAKDMP